MTPKKKKNPADDLINSLTSGLMDNLKNEGADDSTSLLPSLAPSHDDNDDRTLNVAALTPKKSGFLDLEPKVSFGNAKPSARPGAPSGHATVDAQLQQAESFKLAQRRILDLENHLEKLRGENEQLSGIAEIARSREEELLVRIQSLEKTKSELRDRTSQELSIFKDNLQSKEFEATRLRMRVEELESRLQADLKKVRVRERELENRLELSKMEKNALLKSKDDNILDLKRKMDQLYSELEMYKQKCVELGQKIDMNNEQFSRTVRALRLALTNLEANENTNSITLTALKKAD